MKLARLLATVILFAGCSSSDGDAKPKDLGVDTCCEDMDVDPDQQLDAEPDNQMPPDQTPPDMLIFKDTTTPDQTPPPPDLAADTTPLLDSAPDGTPPDTASDVLVADATTDADAGPLWSCTEIYGCARNCTSLSDLACLIPCREAGCASAQTAALDLNTCALTSCSVDCATNGVDCDNCISSNCATELGGCLANVCHVD